MADGLEEELAIPGRYGDDVMQGLMSAPDVVGVRDGRPSVPQFCDLRAEGGRGSSWLRADAGLGVPPLAPDSEGRRQDAIHTGQARGRLRDHRKSLRL
jgi:hypothetical protein